MTVPEMTMSTSGGSRDRLLNPQALAVGEQTQYLYDSLARVIQVGYVQNGLEDQCQRVYYRYDGRPAPAARP
jgi:hypothetical protein